MARVSLKIKIIGIIVITMLVAMGLIIWQNLQTQKAMLSKAAIEYTRVVAETIHNGFITAMAAGENAEVRNILERVKRSDAIAAVRIFDDTGRILISADPEEIGDVIDTPALAALRDGRGLDPHRRSDTGVFCTLAPIENAPACHQCHDPAQRVLGILNVHTTLEHLHSLEVSGRQSTVLTSVGVLVFIITIISLFFIIFVEKPVRRLVRAMTHVERGEFEAGRTRIHSSTEMSLLSDKFNGMVTHLQELIETKLRNEKELAIQQEKLAHHEEIRQMNLTLEDRLKEIEHLNITLEERIEEIEEANYKIADLASELEIKNLNLESAVERLSALYKMGLAINSTMEPEQLFNLLLKKTASALGAEVGYLLLYEAGMEHYAVGAIHGVDSPIPPNERIPIVRGGISKWVIDNRQPLLIEDVRRAEQFSNIGFLGFPRETVICAPLLIKGEVIGTLTIANKQDASSFTEEDLEMLSTIAAQASIAINNARLYEEREKTYMATVKALVSAIEASDAYTRGHSDRVRRYSMAIGERMELELESLKRLEQAAILHDIGKIGIDIGLLHKMGSLSGSDIERLQQHPQIGNSILEPIHFLRDVRTIIAQHHERMDGQGYPAGLHGPEILLEARILAVADTFDAMTSDRPYRRALAAETAIREIREHSGTQFDPEVAAVFVDLFYNDQLDLNSPTDETKSKAFPDQILPGPVTSP